MSLAQSLSLALAQSLSLSLSLALLAQSMALALALARSLSLWRWISLYLCIEKSEPLAHDCSGCPRQAHLEEEAPLSFAWKVLPHV